MSRVRFLKGGHQCLEPPWGKLLFTSEILRALLPIPFLILMSQEEHHKEKALQKYPLAQSLFSNGCRTQAGVLGELLWFPIMGSWVPRGLPSQHGCRHPTCWRGQGAGRYPAQPGVPPIESPHGYTLKPRHCILNHPTSRRLIQKKDMLNYFFPNLRG